MCNERKHMLRQVYDKIKSGDCATLDDIAKNYDPENHPEVVSRQTTSEMHYKNFMSLWNCAKPTDTISYEEFERFYHAISTTVLHDKDFANLLRCEWHI